MTHTLQNFSTVPGMLPGLLANAPSSHALGWREAGYWRRMSSEQFCQDVRRFALGLVRLGLKHGDTVGILAPSSPHWLIADFGIMSAGGVSVPLFPNLSPDHLAYESANVSLRFLVVIGEEQWRLAAPHLDRYEGVIVKCIGDSPDSVTSWQRLLEMGDALSEQDPGLFVRRRDHLTARDVATIIHTSGSTGTPKGVVLTHGNMVSQITGARTCFPLVPGTDRALSCLPLAHVFERLVVYCYLSQGVPVSFADDVKNVGVLLREARPTVMTMVPRLIEKLHARIVKQIDGALPPRRQLGRWALGMATSDDPTQGKSWANGVADSLVYRKLREALGGRLTTLIVGGAALAPDLGRFLTNVGIPVYTGYGLTEASPVITVNHPECNRLGTVGKPFPGVEVRIATDGEIQARGPNIMTGYHRDPKATVAVIDGEGWLHTGDLGRFDSDGFLIITGRVKELLKTSNGKYVCPVPIEQALASSRLIDLAMVVAEGRRFVSALLFADLDAVRQAKEQRGQGQLSDADFLDSAPIRQEMQTLLAEVNRPLDRWEQVRSYRFVTTTPTVEDELTPTMKIRRHVVAEKYGKLIEEMYHEVEEPVAH